jgi:outer membrane protein assembly factor BamB
MAIHLVSAIDTHDFGADTVRIGDLNGDGAPDLLFAQNIYGSREIQCLTATTIYGERLWQTGTPSAVNGRVYCDLPVQVYDWDNDGVNEVLYVQQAHYAEPIEYRLGDDVIRERAKRYEGQATLHVLDGLTGKEKASLPFPAPADDSFLFADLTGRGRREDFVVKDRYWTMWGVARTGEVLWRWEGSTGHYPAIADVDGDGRDEVFTGYALIDHDGTPLFEHAAGDSHQDAAYVVRMPDGAWRLLFGNHGVHCLAVDGTEVWHLPMREAQHVVVGHYRADSALQAAVIDRGYPRTATGNPAMLYLFDLQTGQEIWRRAQPAGGWGAACTKIRWTGQADREDMLVYMRGVDQPIAVYDGDGTLVDEAAVPPEICSQYDSGEGITPSQHYCSRADVYGDSREEIILTGWKGARIYANARPLAIPTLYNNTYYPGM